MEEKSICTTLNPDENSITYSERERERCMTNDFTLKFLAMYSYVFHQIRVHVEFLEKSYQNDFNFNLRDSN